MDKAKGKNLDLLCSNFNCYRTLIERLPFIGDSLFRRRTYKLIRGDMGMNKNFLKSKTLWFNVLTIGLACFVVVTDNVDIQPAYVGIVNGIGNVFLRFLTKEKLLLK